MGPLSEHQPSEKRLSDSRSEASRGTPLGSVGASRVLPQAVSPLWELWACKWPKSRATLCALSCQTAKNVNVAYRRRGKGGLTAHPTLPGSFVICGSESKGWWKQLRCAPLPAHHNVHFADPFCFFFLSFFFKILSPQD